MIVTILGYDESFYRAVVAVKLQIQCGRMDGFLIRPTDGVWDGGKG